MMKNPLKFKVITYLYFSIVLQSDSISLNKPTIKRTVVSQETFVDEKKARFTRNLLSHLSMTLLLR